jgi:conjugal transfer pilus assembly protein TraK
MMKAYFLKLLFIIIFALGFVQNSFALQVKSVTENGEVSAIVASQDLTRIAIDHDRIARVRGLEGAYELKQDAVQGALFIRPTSDYQTKPFTLFIATEKNHNYVLHLTPKEQWGDTILLKHKTIPKPYARSKHNVSSTRVLTHFMRQLISGHTPPHYSMRDFTHTRRYAVNNELTVKPIRMYSGKYLRGYVYQITNHSQNIITLSEAGFYQDGDKAIALSQLIVAPGGQVILYKVRGDE